MFNHNMILINTFTSSEIW